MASRSSYKTAGVSPVGVGEQGIESVTTHKKAFTPSSAVEVASQASRSPILTAGGRAVC